MSDSKPTCAPQHSATNPKGQMESMSGAAKGHTPPSTPLVPTPNIAIDPCSSQGANTTQKC